jgi:hypothetical protein
VRCWVDVDKDARIPSAAGKEGGLVAHLRRTLRSAVVEGGQGGVEGLRVVRGQQVSQWEGDARVGVVTERDDDLAQVSEGPQVPTAVHGHL